MGGEITLAGQLVETAVDVPKDIPVTLGAPEGRITW